MIGFKFSAIGSDKFFNSEKVLKALSATERRVLSKFGAFVRQRARTSIRPAVVVNRKEIRSGKKAGRTIGKVYAASKPGEPPRSRQGDLKRKILFGYDTEARAVVIGPTLVGGRASDTPARLEYGGQFRHKRSGKIVRVRKRPFMQPAFESEVTKMPALWADSLRG